MFDFLFVSDSLGWRRSFRCGRCNSDTFMESPILLRQSKILKPYFKTRGALQEFSLRALASELHVEGFVDDDVRSLRLWRAIHNI